jgi:hypothetical protein
MALGERGAAGLGGADSLREWVDRCDRLVEVDEEREKVMLALVERVLSEDLDMREIDCWRLTASMEAFLV